MASVPYNPLPNVAPASIGAAPQIRVKANAQDFGANIGQATQGLGQSLQHVGDVAAHYAIQEQLEKNDVELTNAQTQMNEKFSEVNSWYRSLEGMAAVDAEKEAIQRFKQARQDVRSTLTNDAVKRAYDRATTQTEGFAIRETATYKAGQQKVAAHNASNASIEQSKAQAAQPGLPEDLFGIALGNIDINVEKQMISAGWGNDMARLDDGTMIFADTQRGKQAEAIYKAQLDQHVGPAFEGRVRTMATENIQTAMNYLDSNKDHMPPDVYAKLRAGMITPFRDAEARTISDQTMGEADTEYKKFVSNPKNRYVKQADWLVQNQPKIIENLRKKAQAKYPGDVREADAAEGRLRQDIRDVISVEDASVNRTMRNIQVQQFWERRAEKADRESVFKYITQAGPNKLGINSMDELEAAPPNIRAAAQRIQSEQPVVWESFIKKVTTQNTVNDGGSLGAAWWPIYNKVMSGEIEDPSDLGVYLQAELKQNSPLSKSGLKAIVQEMEYFNTPEGKAFKAAEFDFMQKAAKQIIGRTQGVTYNLPTVNDPKVREFMQQVMPQIRSGRQKGLTAAQLFDPDSKDYIGGGIKQFQRTMAENFSQSTKAMNDILKPGQKFDIKSLDTLSDNTGDVEGNKKLQEAVAKKQISAKEAREYSIKRGWARHRYEVPAGGL